MRMFRWSMAVLAFLCIVRLLCTLSADLIAWGLGCEFDLVAARPCVVAGHDIGHALLILGMQGYAQFFTTPLLILLVPIWIVVEIVRWVRLRWRRAAAA